MKRIKQLRYYNDGNINNFPPMINQYQLLNDDHNVFKEYYPILQLGIQSIPGTKFFLNSGTEPIIIGNTGIYELDLGDKAEISALSFSAESLDFINENENAYLIVDIIYEAEEE